MSNLSSPFVSVIIPVFNDSQRLKSCLEALENQTYPNLYEVIVVDNGSDEDIKSVVVQFGQAVATQENRPSSYAARNKGLSLAKGEIVAFTDADCIPAPDWIEKGVANLLRMPNCGLIAGKVKLFFKDSNKPTPAEIYESINTLQQKKFIEEHGYGATANLFTYRNVIDTVGLFDDTLKSGGDFEWCQRVLLAGYKQFYADDTVIQHPARHSLAELYKRTARINGGVHDRKKTSGYPFKEFITDIAKDLLPPFRLYFRIFSDERLPGSRQKIQYIFVFLLLKYLRVWGKIRLRLGVNSIRG